MPNPQAKNLQAKKNPIFCQDGPAFASPLCSVTGWEWVQEVWFGAQGGPRWVRIVPSLVTLPTKGDAVFYGHITSLLTQLTPWGWSYIDIPSVIHAWRGIPYIEVDKTWVELGNADHDGVLHFLHREDIYVSHAADHEGS